MRCNSGLRNRGFTLMEILVALAITAMLAVMAYSGLSTALAARERLQAAEQQDRQLHLFFEMIGRDLRMSAARPIRDEFDNIEPAMQKVAAASSPLLLSRRGWENPADQQRGTLQRVAWELRDKTVYRDAYRVLDRGAALEPAQRAVLDGVDSLRIRFLSLADTNASERNWREDWSVDSDDEIPLAVEVQLEMDGTSSIRRLFLPVARIE